MPRIISKRLAARDWPKALMTGMPPHDAGFEVQGHVVLARQGEELGAFLGDELFVGRDHVLAGFERSFDEGLSGLECRR
jgi:hypothetical protein